MSERSFEIVLLTDNANLSQEIIRSFDPFLPANTRLSHFPHDTSVQKILEAKPSLIFLDLSNVSNSLIPLIEAILFKKKDVMIIGIGSPTDVTLVMKLVKMGVNNFLVYPLDAAEIENVASLIKNRLEKNTLAGTKSSTKIVTLYSPKGGTGVTLLTVNLAVALAANRQKKVLICDFSPQCGDTATYLNITPQYTIRDIIDNHTILDQSFLEGVLLEHPSGVKILPAPKEDQEPPNSNHLNTIKSVLDLLKSSFDFILIDGGYLDRTLLQYVMSESNLIFLVGSPDVVSLKGLVSFFNKLSSLHYDRDKIKLIVNRYNSKNQIDTREFERMIKQPISFQLPNNYMDCIEAVNAGKPIKEIHEKSDLVKKINEIADVVRKL